MLRPDQLAHLQGIVGPENVLHRDEEVLVYECDGYTVERHPPDCVVLPASTAETAAVVRYCREEKLPFLPRGAGTSLSGGTLPAAGGVMIGLSRMNRVLEVDYRNRQALVEAGVVNLRLSRHCAARGYHYAPDPSSQGACTIGGNIGTNSGGPHTLKYGVTTNHVLAAEVVLPSGEVVWLGSRTGETPGYDLLGVMVGSEGTLGLVTRAWVRIVRNPQATRTLLGVFDSIDDATRAVSGIIAAGIIPAALEMMDQLILEAVEAAYGFGFPLDAAAVLIAELDGLEAGLEELAGRTRRILEEHGARAVRRARTEQERAALWASRKKAFGAIGRLSPSYITQDGVVPRTRLPEILRIAAEVGRRHGLRIANVFHAGDGNIHPILLFDERDPDQVRRVLAASEEIMRACVELGGTITGEHGIGIEKIDFLSFLFDEADLRVQGDVRAVFNPDGLCNPGKVLPTPAGCVEVKRPRPRAAV